MRLRAGLLWLLLAALVAHLSFIPYYFQVIDFDDALGRFARLPYLNLGAGNRADWVANILLFLPLGWLAAAFFVPHPRRRFDLLAVLPSLALGTAWAIAVEFGQLYFPNRTVSINDILAEVIGAFMGAWMWSAFGARSLGWWRELIRGGRATADAVLAAYLLVYLGLSLSPFDFVISADELAEKIASNLHGWWLAPVGCGRTPCSAKLFAEALAVLPVGWWLAMRRGGGPGSVAAAGVLGAGLGVVIELAQFLLVSGTSQGASVAARVAGVAAGAWLYTVRDRLLGVDWARWGRPLVLAAVVPWLAAVAYVGGWFGGRWLGLDAGLSRLPGVEWMPFYYQYYSTEQALIRSTLVHLALYAPVGAAVWLWGRRTRSGSGAAAAMLAAATATVAETGKLFIQGKHPDYADVLFAMAAAWTAATLLRWASDGPRSEPASTRRVLPQLGSDAGRAGSREAVIRSGSQADGTATAAEVAPVVSGLSSSWAGRAMGGALLLLVLVSLARFPLWQVFLGLGLAAYAVLLTRRPLAYLLVVPAALPLLDLAPHSGRFFWDEFDLLLATTLGARLLTTQEPAGEAPKVPRAGLAMLAASVLVSVAIALWPPAPLDANAFTNYLSPYNALRVGKGYLWGAMLLWLLWRDAAASQDVASRLRLGLGLALLAAVLGVFWERLLFVGLADFDGGFRAAGLVSATHVGGAYLEALLVVLAPFSLSLALSDRRPAVKVFWFAVTALGALAVLMTLSRAAVMAWLIGVGAFALLWWFSGKARASPVGVDPRRAFGAVALVVALVGAGALMGQSTALRDRLSGSGSDFGVRLAHWRATLDLMSGDPLHTIFGMGLGSFPREFYLAQASATRLPAYRIEREAGGGRRLLMLAGGNGMYLDQRVEAVPGRALLLRGEIRSSRDGAELAVALCEKSFLASVRCDWVHVPARSTWAPFETRLQLPEAGPARFGPAVPVSLSLHNSSPGIRIEITQLSLGDGREELLSNGSFERGLDRWLMHSDVHLAWRALSSPVQIMFEQGLFGLAAWVALAAGAIGAIARSPHGVPAAAAAAAIAFLAVGCFDTLLDAPRLVVLAAFVLWSMIHVLSRRPQDRRHIPRRRGPAASGDRSR
jgi:VanZ family protein